MARNRNSGRKRRPADTGAAAINLGEATNTDLIAHKADKANPHDTSFTLLIDTPVSYTGFGRNALRVNPAEDALEFDNTVMRWQNVWVQQTYYTGDVVRDSDYLMIANKETIDRAAPQKIGEVFTVYQGAGLNETPTLAKQIIFGNRYTVTINAFAVGYRVDVVAGNVYTVFTVFDPLGTPIVRQELIFTAEITGWREVAIQAEIIKIGSVFDLVCVVQEPDPTPTTFTGDWNYTTPQNSVPPAVGVIVQARGNPQLLQVNTTDFNGGDRTAELATLTVGDQIDGANSSWAIQAITDNTTWFDFTVAPASIGAPLGVQLFTFETVVPTPITTGEDLDYWLTSIFNGQGLWIADGDYDSIVPNDSAYGTDVFIQQADISDDWDLMSISN
jgi:hypothetical protein